MEVLRIKWARPDPLVRMVVVEEAAEIRYSTVPAPRAMAHRHWKYVQRVVLAAHQKRLRQEAGHPAREWALLNTAEERAVQTVMELPVPAAAEREAPMALEDKADHVLQRRA